MVQMLGGDYPLTVIMPIFLILAGVVFFITTYIRDNIGKLRLRVKKKHQKEEKQIIDFNAEFSHLKKQLPHLNASGSLDAITILTKQFLAHKLNITREFTFEELPRNKLDWSVIEFTKRLEDLKYSGREITKAEIDHLMLFLSKILKFRHLEEKREKPKLISRLFPIILPKLPRIVIKLPHIKPPTIKIKPHKEIKPIEVKIPLPKKIIINLSWLFKKREHPEVKHEIKEVHKEKHRIEIPPEPEHHKIHHRHKPSIFERMRINSQANKVLKLIRKAEKKSLMHPVIAKKLYDESLLMYYRLPIDKEEDIAIRLDKFYEKINGRHEKELLNIKHSGKKATKEALKHLKKYRNYVIIENNHLSNNVRRSLYELKKQAVAHLSRTKHRKVKSKLYKFMKALSKEEHNISALEESSIENLIHKSYSLLRTISRLEGREGYDTYAAIRKLFSHLKIEHRMPRHQYIEIKPREIPREIPTPEQHYKLSKSDLLYPEIKPVDFSEEIKHEIKPAEKIFKQEKPLRIEPPEIKIVSRKKIEIAPPKFPEKKISERMKKLMEEKESVYNKLREVEGKELDRFKQAKRMTIHNEIGYHDFISNLKPRIEPHEEHKHKRIFEAE